MSSMPMRTRSMRKPTVGGGQFDSSAATAPAERGGTRDQIDPKPSERKTNTSPSRLPKPPSTTPGLPRKPSVSQAGSGNNNSSNGSMRPPPRRATTSRPPLTSDNVRPASHRSGARTPTESSSSSSTNQRASSIRHSRNASTSTLPSTSTFPAATSNHSTRSTSIIPSSVATIFPLPPSHASSTTSSQSRQPQLQPSNQIPPLHPPETTKHHQQLQSRPAFSTLQQHYSPLKTLGPKPTTASFLVPPSPGKLPSNIQLSAETARLQTELLQLHILHRAAPRISAEYRSSAKRALRTKFGDVAVRQRELVAAEAREEGRLNGLVLKTWSEGGRGWGLEEKAQRLDEVVTGVWSLGEAGGRYVRLVRRFEKWLGRTQETLDSRAGKAISASGDLDLDSSFVRPLEDGWRDECEHLARKLDLWQEQLRDLDVPDAESNADAKDTRIRSDGGRSSLASTVRGFQTLVKRMLAELSIMARLEREIVQREEEWIHHAVDAMSDGEEEGSAPSAIWRIH